MHIMWRTSKEPRNKTIFVYVLCVNLRFYILQYLLHGPTIARKSQICISSATIGYNLVAYVWN